MISYKHVTKIYGEGRSAVTALSDVSFTVERGKIVVLLGPSGCGKTTLLRCTNRLESITRGKILIAGKDIMNMDVIGLRRQIGYVIQNIGLFPHKTIAENIAVVPRLMGWNAERIAKRVDELLTMLRLDPEIFRFRYPAELSGGQQQRVGVARALAADPEILLMDEPFAAIDPINREQIQDEFLKLQEQLKKTIVFVSHDIHEAVKMGDMIALFNQGRLVQYDPPELLLTHPKNKYVADFVGSDRALKVLSIILAKDIMDPEPFNIVKGKDSVQEVLKVMEEKGWEYAIVIDQGRPVGYVKFENLKYKRGHVIELAESYPAHIFKKTPARDVLSYMLMSDLSHLCVVDDNGDFIGTVTYDDIKKKVRQSYTIDSGRD